MRLIKEIIITAVILTLGWYGTRAIENKTKKVDFNWIYSNEIAPKQDEPQVEPTREVVAREEPRESRDYHAYIKMYFPKDAWAVAERIAICESGGRAEAIHRNTNGTSDYSIFQVNSIHAWRVGGDTTKLLDIETNVRVASEIFKEQNNWSAWNSSKRCWSK